MLTLAPHETLELHELLRSEVLTAKKLKATIPMIQDPDLKTATTNCLNARMRKINDIQQFCQSTGMLQ
ncbi:hypothetical protein [Heliophilum fasciatum]|nr:hypothetical protein [Heliophilum fasciatum]MCW2277085.1 hypothetical protein [Heliophilum fasciatum]